MRLHSRRPRHREGKSGSSDLVPAGVPPGLPAGRPLCSFKTERLPELHWHPAAGLDWSSASEDAQAERQAFALARGLS